MGEGDASFHRASPSFWGDDVGGGDDDAFIDDVEVMHLDRPNRLAPCTEGAEGEEEDEDEEFDEKYARPMTATCIEGIIARATDQLGVECPSPRSGAGSSCNEFTIAESCGSRSSSIVDDAAPSIGGPEAEAASPSCLLPASISPRPLAAPSAPAPTPAVGVSPAGSPRGVGGASPSKRVRPAGAGRSRNASNPLRAAAIAQVLAAARCAADVRACAASFGGGFGRVPVFLRPVVAELDSEQRYISLLHEPREIPKNRVRLLAKGEKDALLGGLKQQFQRTTARYLKEVPKSRSKAVLEAELARIRQDLESLSRPYVFVLEDPHGNTAQ